jgi:hypothetical protein
MSEEIDMVVGIDNGLDGGLCAISSFDGSVIAMTKMPTLVTDKKREIDTRKVHRWILDLNTPFLLAVEEPLAHAKSSQAMRSMALSFGKLMGMAESHHYKVKRVSVHLWQKSVLGKRASGNTKKAALLAANKLAPREQWLASARCSKPHDGMVDAFLIAHYARLSTHKLK